MAFTLIFGLFVGFADGFIMRSLPPVLDQLLAMYNVSYAGISVLLSAHMWSHAAIQVPGGMIVDRLGTRRTLGISMGCLVLGCVIPSLVPNFYVGVAGRVVAGIGTGLTFIVSMKMFTLNAPKKYIGVFQSLLGGIFGLGSIPAYYLLPKLVVFGWRAPFFSPAFMVLFALAILPFIKLNPENLGQVPLLPLRKVVVIRGAWVIGLFHSLSFGSIIMLSNWAPSILAEASGQTATTPFLWLAMVFVLVSGICRMLSGFVLFRMRAWTLAFSTITLIAVCYFLMALFKGPLIVAILTIILAVFASINYGAIWTMASGLAETASLGTVLGFVNLLANLFSVFYTMIFGWAKDLFGTFSWAMVVMTVVTAASLIFGHLMFSKKAREIQRQ